MNELETILSELPFEIRLDDVNEREQLDERVSAVGTLFANTIGVLVDGLEFCPNEDPPETGEALSWIWVYRPDLGTQMEKMDISEDFRELIKFYQEDRMDEHWKLIS